MAQTLKKNIDQEYVNVQDERHTALMATRMLLFVIEDIRDLGITDCNTLLSIAVKEIKLKYNIKAEEICKSFD